MLLQRLTDDNEIGYNYDYMGSAEYENGATLEGRVAIARLFIDGEMVARQATFSEAMGKMKSKPVSVLAIGSKATLDKLGKDIVIKVTKEAFRTDQPGIVGWMHVPYGGEKDKDFEPLLIVRNDADNSEAGERVQKFLAGAVHAIREHGVVHMKSKVPA